MDPVTIVNTQHTITTLKSENVNQQKNSYPKTFTKHASHTLTFKGEKNIIQHKTRYNAHEA